MSDIRLFGSFLLFLALCQSQSSRPSAAYPSSSSSVIFFLFLICKIHRKETLVRYATIHQALAFLRTVFPQVQMHFPITMNVPSWYLFFLYFPHRTDLVQFSPNGSHTLQNKLALKLYERH